MIQSLSCAALGSNGITVNYCQSCHVSSLEVIEADFQGVLDQLPFTFPSGQENQKAAKVQGGRKVFIRSDNYTYWQAG